MATGAAGSSTRPTVAFPVSHGGVRGDNTVHIYADDPTWVLFGREVMGWPTLFGEVDLSPAPTELRSGVVLEGSLRRFGADVLRASVTLGARVPPATIAATVPVWLTEKVIPDVAGGAAALHQIVQTGPSEARRGAVWDCSAKLELPPSQYDELHHLGPLDVVRAQYWSDLTLTLAPGRVLTDLSGP